MEFYTFTESLNCFLMFFIVLPGDTHCSMESYYLWDEQSINTDFLILWAKSFGVGWRVNINNGKVDDIYYSGRFGCHGYLNCWKENKRQLEISDSFSRQVQCFMN